jgi:type IV pilus assembly protein PilC
MRVSKKRLSPASTGLLYRQMAIMIASDVPVSEAFQVMAEESDLRKVRKIASAVSDDLKKGKPLDESLKKYPSVFSDFVITLFQGVEDKKKVAEALFQMADATEDADIIKSKLFRALFFPSVTMAFGIFLLMVITVFVIPVFKDMFYGLGGNLPGPTQYLFNISEWVIRNFLYLFILGIILVVLMLKFRRVAYLLATLIPGCSRLLKRASVVSFTKHLSIMLSFGLPVKKAYDKAVSTVKNMVHARKLAAAAEAISSVEQLEGALKSTGFFSKIILRMIHYGSRSNTLPLALKEITHFYEKDFDRSVNSFLRLMEILVIFAVGSIIGYIVISLYLPLFKMAGAIL